MIFYTLHISSSFRNNHIITITIIPYVSIKVNAFGSKKKEKSNSQINSRECDFCFFKKMWVFLWKELWVIKL